MPRASGSNDVASTSAEEQQRQETPVEEDIGVNRFLKQRKRSSTGCQYKKNTAHCPSYQKYAEDEDDEDREIPLVLEPLDEFCDQDLARFKQAVPHLPDDSAIQILSFYEYDIDRAIKQAQQMAVPKLIPECHKKIIVANIAMEKDLNPTKRQQYKEFYFQKLMKKTVDSKTLVDFYYREKNKIGGNWRMEHEDPEETPQSRAELEEKLQKAGITFVTGQRGNNGQRGSSVQKSSTRKSNRTRRSEVERLQDDSEPSTSGSPAPSSSSSSNGASSSNGSQESSVEPPRINLRFRFTPGVPNSNISIINTPKKEDPSIVTRSAGPSTRSSDHPNAKETPRKRRSIGSTLGDSTVNGVPRSYPKRERKSTGSTE